MSWRTCSSDNPGYGGRLAASAVCIPLLRLYLISALPKLSFDPDFLARVLAAMAAVFAAVTIAISDSGAVAGDDS